MAPSAPPGEMQEPTCSGTFIRTVQDVHRIFYAVLLGKLPIVTRRLDAQERDALNAGCCYVWEERGPQSVTGLGIERFTEGRRWSASRVRDDFLFYYEKFKGATEDQRPPRDWDPLVKQTYSVFVNPSPGQPEPVPPKKWHLTAYYTDNAIDSLHTVDDLPATKDLRVPDGVFRCSRSIKPRSRARPASRTPRIAPSKATTKTATLASSLPASSSPTAAGPSRPPKRKRSVPARTRSSKKVKEEPAPSPTPAPPSPAPSASVSPAASPESALTDLPSRSSSVESQDHVKHELKIQTDIIALEERGVSISPMHGTSGKQSASRSPMSARPSPQETRANRKTDGFSSSRSPQTARAPVQGSGLSVFAPFPSDASPPPSSKTYTQLHTDTQSQLQPRAHAQAPHGAPLAAAAAATAARPDSPLHAHDIGSNLYPRSSQAQAHAPQFSSMQLSVSPIHPSSIQPQLTHVQNQFTTVPPAQISFQESLPAHDGFPTVNSPLASAVYSASQASPVHDQPLPVGAGFAGEARRDRTSEHVVSSYSGYPMGNTGMHRIAPAASSFAPLEPPMAPPPTSTGQGTPTPSGLHDYSHSYGPGYHTAFQSTPSSTAGNVDAFRNYASSSNSLAMAFPRSSNAPPITSAVTASTPSSARSPGLSAAHPPAGSWSGGGGATQHFGGATPGTLPFAGSQAGIQGYEANHDSGYSAVQTQEQMGAEFVDAQMQDYGRGQTQGYSVIQQTYAQPEYAYTHQFPSPTFGGSAADFNNISDGGHLHPSDAPDGQEPVLRGSASGVIKQQQQGSAFIDTQHKYVTSQALPNSFDDFRSQGSSFSSRTNVSLELDTMSSSTSSWYPGPSPNHFDPPSPAVPQYGLSPQTLFSRAGTAYSTASTPARSQALRGRSQSLADAFAFMPEPSPAPSMLSNSSGSSGSSGGHGSGRVGGWAGERRALVNPQHLRRVNPAKPREPSDSQALQMFGRVA